jgi:hypothetical protein
MKTVIVIILLLFLSLSVTSQDTDSLKTKAEIQKEISISTYSFIPDKRLLNKYIWKRVSEYRFECAFLKLAVEFDKHTHDYVLLEMEGGKREIFRDIHYELVSQVICRLTLNITPNI